MIKKKIMTLETFAERIETNIAITFDEKIDNLAVMVKKGFRELEGGMAKQEDLLALTARIGVVERYLEKIDQHLSDHDRKFGDLDVRTGELEKKLKMKF